VDLLQHADEAGASRREVAERVGRAVASGRFDAARLRDMAERCARKSVRALLDPLLVASAP
jgi:hypothetical protein